MIKVLDVLHSHLKSYGLHDGNEKKENKKENIKPSLNWPNTNVV